MLTRKRGKRHGALLKLDIIKNEKSLGDLKNLSEKIIKGEVKGRTIINVNL